MIILCKWVRIPLDLLLIIFGTLDGQPFQFKLIMLKEKKDAASDVK